MNNNLGIRGDEVDQEMPLLVDTRVPVLPDIRGKGKIRRQLPSPRPQEYYRGYENIADYDGPLVLPSTKRPHFCGKY